ncbi:hypothetical protein [Halobacillus sp. Marseille-Q1614]|uniref:hypothetical protein n=1 Tax=Halobacillus sp. Marseille-Q1614 TaxID=2709134 RepID=UPI00156DF59F|nr:hypothetical protein [Halobacillus sp. Marseille-Q1614]
MKRIKIDKVYHMDNNTEVDFSKGLLLIDDKGAHRNWNVSLSKVKEPSGLQSDDASYSLQFTDFEGTSYVGTAVTEHVSKDGTVLMASKGELKEEQMKL